MIRPDRHSIATPSRTPCAAVWLLSAALALVLGPVGGRPGLLAADEETADEKGAEAEEKEAADEAERKTAPPAPPAKPAAGTRAAGPAARKGTAAPEAPLRFTDEDLEKYRKPLPPEELEEEAEAPAAAAPAPAAAAPPADPNKPRRILTKPRPPRPPPPPDPLKSFKDRDAMETFRKEQIQTLRGRVTELEGRLGYLNAKRDALLNPAPLQAGHTRAGEGPNPYRPGDPFGGAGKTPIGGFFPPIPPAQTDEDRQKDKTLKIKELIADVEKEIEAVEADLEKAREDLVAAELRFGAGAGLP